VHVQSLVLGPVRMAELIRESDPDGAAKLSSFAREGRYLAVSLLSGAHGSRPAYPPSLKEVEDWEATALRVRGELNQIDPEFCKEHPLVRNRVNGKGVVMTTMRPDEHPVAPPLVLGAPPATHNGREDGQGPRDTGSRSERRTRDYEGLVELASEGLRERDSHPMHKSVRTPEAFYEVMTRAALDAAGLRALLNELRFAHAANDSLWRRLRAAEVENDRLRRCGQTVRPEDSGQRVPGFYQGGSPNGLLGTREPPEDSPVTTS